MATKWTSPVWRMPENSNQSKIDNYSLDFDGSSDYIDLGTGLDIFKYNVNEEYSVSVWVNFTSTAGDKTIINLAANTYKFFLAAGNSGTISFGVSNNVNIGSNYNHTPTAGLINDGNWHHICIVGASNSGSTSSFTVYVDGISGSAGISATFRVQNNNRIGLGHYGGFNGKISQCSIFNYALSETQVKYLFNNNAGGSTPNPQNPMAIAGPTPIAYYPLGQSATGDDNTLTVPNESGNGDTVFDFDGTNPDNISFGTGIGDVIGDNYTGGMSISLWFKADVTGGQEKGLFVFSTGNNNFGEITAYFQLNSLRLLVKNNTVLNHTFTDTTSWHNLFINFIGPSGDNQVYLDGAPIGSTFTYTDLDLNGKNLTIGYTYSTTYDYQGKMSNFQIWNTSLSGAEITTLYNGGRPYTGTQPQAANLKGWWKLNVDTSNFTDGNQWEVGNSTSDFSSSLKFTGNSQLNLSEINLGTTNSISFWFKVTNVPASNNDFYFLGADNNASNYVLYSANGTSFSLRISPSSDTGFLTFTSTPTLWDGKWHNLLITRNNSTFNMYVDGVALTSPTGSVGTGNTVIDTIANQNNNGVPGYAIYNDAFTGELSNLVVWNSDQTSEKDNIYNNGSPATSYTNTPVSWWKLDNLTTGIQDSVGSNNATLQGTGTSQLNTPVSALNGVSSGMTTANLVTSDLNRSLLYSSYSMVFDGASDKITLPSAVRPTNIMTVSQWLKAPASGHNFSYSLSTLGSNGSWAGISMYHASATSLQFQIQTGGVAKLTSAVNINDGNWHHVVGVYNGSDIRIYLDGQEQGSPTSVSGDISYNSSGTSDIAIGNWPSANYDFNGNISNTAIWHRALSENEILKVYNGGASNDISSLSPFGWWSLSGDSYFASDWICPDLSANSNNGTGSNLAVTALVGDAPGSTANGTGTSMAIPTNLKGNAPNSDKNSYSVNMVATNRDTSVPNISS